MVAAKEPRHSADEIIAITSQASAALRRTLPGADVTAAESDPTLRTISTAELRAAFREITRIRGIIPLAPSEGSPEIAAAVKEYQRLLARFRAELPRIHGWLLAERARLANRRSHSAAVASWMRTRRQTRR